MQIIRIHVKNTKNIHSSKNAVGTTTAEGAHVTILMPSVHKYCSPPMPTQLRLARPLARTTHTHTHTRNETEHDFPIGGLMRRLFPSISDLFKTSIFIISGISYFTMRGVQRSLQISPMNQ